MPSPTHTQVAGMKGDRGQAWPGHFQVIVLLECFGISKFEQIIAIDFIFIILHKYVFYDPIMGNIRAMVARP